MRCKPHEEKADRVHQEGPEVKPFRTVSMCQGAPEGGSEGSTEGGARHDRPDPEERLLRRIGAYFQNIEGQEDLDEIPRESSSELREGDGVEIPPALFYGSPRVTPFLVNVSCPSLTETLGVNGILRERDEIVNGQDPVAGHQASHGFRLAFPER